MVQLAERLQEMTRQKVLRSQASGTIPALASLHAWHVPMCVILLLVHRLLIVTVARHCMEQWQMA